ncbi:MAG: AbrB/MazE/SpoVT family DNA-binding domain-containing protein [Oscillospiraceae bacterium]|nr:AbrB/MazE/SpoVT family DNA-binding domain-containing protein [Oscillospiraceae bacterium]
MKFTGFVRQIDPVGRIVLPMHLREKLGLKNKEFVEFYVDGESIVLRKYHPACIFCDSADDIVQYAGKSVCRACVEKIHSELS